MLISYRGELGEPVARQVEMAVHTQALFSQLNIPTYHFHHSMMCMNWTAFSNTALWVKNLLPS